MHVAGRGARVSRETGGSGLLVVLVWHQQAAYWGSSGSSGRKSQVDTRGQEIAWVTRAGKQHSSCCLMWSAERALWIQYPRLMGA